MVATEFVDPPVAGDAAGAIVVPEDDVRGPPTLKQVATIASLSRRAGGLCLVKAFIRRWRPPPSLAEAKGC